MDEEVVETFNCSGGPDGTTRIKKTNGTLKTVASNDGTFYDAIIHSDDGADATCNE